MKQSLWCTILAFVLLATLSPAFSAPVMATDIDDDEYAVYHAALGNLDGVFVAPVKSGVIFDGTLTKYRLNAESLADLARGGLTPDPAMIADFNLKNAKSYRIAPGRIPPPFTVSDNWIPLFPGEGSVERLELSRVGFDSERQHALVVVSYTFLGGQRAFQSSGGYMMLKKQDGRWLVTGKAGGWAIHY